MVRDGATVENVYFTDLIIHCNRKHFNWWGDGDPIRFILLKRNAASRLGRIRHVYVRNVQASGEGTSLIKGYEGRPLENIVLENVRLEINTESLPDKRASDILQLQQLQDASLRNVQLVWNEANGREPRWAWALHARQVSGLRLTDVEVGGRGGKQRPIRLDSCSRIFSSSKPLSSLIDQ